MISVGIDVSKGKSTIAIFKPYGEIVAKPFDVKHTKEDLQSLAAMIRHLNDEVRVTMESTGIYHWPVLQTLLANDIFTVVVNPYAMKLYRKQSIRKGKTDKMDAMAIAQYGLDHWVNLESFESTQPIYDELKLLGRRYRHYMRMHIDSLQELTHILDMTMPGINKVFAGWQERSGRNKVADFAAEFWHYDNITKMSESQFVKNYEKWNKEKGYRMNETKAVEVYTLARNSIPTLPVNYSSAKMMVQEAVRVLQSVDATLYKILAQMKELAKSLPEYGVVRNMGGVGDVLAPKLIAEIGDVRRFHSGKALIAYAGLDAPPYQSGKFTGTERHISKRGSSNLRKIGYEVMRCLKCHSAPNDSQVYDFILKKEKEGKNKAVAKIAGLNKFLRIYYARVKEVYRENDYIQNRYQKNLTSKLKNRNTKGLA
jgi:transposase